MVRHDPQASADCHWLVYDAVFLAYGSQLEILVEMAWSLFVVDRTHARSSPRPGVH